MLKKIENTAQPVVGLDFHTSTIKDIDHDALWLALLNEVRQPGAHAPNRSVTDSDAYNGRKLSSIGSTQHVNVRKKELEGCSLEMSLMEKIAEPNAPYIVRRHSFEMEVCERDVRCGFRQHSSIAISEAAVLFDLRIKFVRKSVG